MQRPKKCISVEEAREYQNNWKKTRGREIRQGQGYEDTREFWYSLDELQEYLDYVREKSSMQDIKNPGIRIYLSAYPKTADKKSYTTLFLAPTKKNTEIYHEESEDSEEQENNYEIEPLNIITGGWPPKDY